MLPIMQFNRFFGKSSLSAPAVCREREVLWRRLFLTVILVLVLATARICLAAENEFGLYPKWVRPVPESVFKVKLPAGIDTNKKLFLRLTRQPHTFIIDLPLTGEPARGRVVDVRIPVSLKRGTYMTELVNEDGAVLASGPQNIKVAAAQKPVISAIMPKTAYPQNDRYSFEIIGDNLADFEEDKITIRINDVAFEDMKKCPVDASGKVRAPLDEKSMPCLVSDWRSIRIYGLSIDKLDIGRPLEVSIEVDKLISDPKPLALSYVQRYTPILISFLVLAMVTLLLYFFFIRKRADVKYNKAYSPWLYLIIDPQSNTYSLSKLQMIIWAAAAIVAYSYLAASQFLVQWKLGIPNVPGGLPLLLGISAGTTALAVGATEFRGSKGAGMIHPALSDFISQGGVFAPERLQFFIWTILGAITFVAATLAQDPGTVSEMATIPDTFNQLMGASSLGYLAGKFSRKPGPVIKSVIIDKLPEEIKITGENLSPRAQLWINSEPSVYQVAPDFLKKNAAEEFVSVLKLMPAGENKGTDNVTEFKIKNPDGQVADWIQNAVHNDEIHAKNPGKK